MKTQGAGTNPRVVTGERPKLQPKAAEPAPLPAPRPPGEVSGFDRGPRYVDNPRLSSPDLRPQSRPSAPPPAVQPDRPAPPPNGVARLDEVRGDAGMVTGQITVNGHTYDFRSGRDDPPRLHVPPGDYRVADLGRTDQDAMKVDGEGWRFRIEDPSKKPGNDSFGDSRTNPNPDAQQGMRQYLRIHPDGAAPGTDGCLGILGNAETLKQFRADLQAELARNPNFRLRVEGPA